MPCIVILDQHQTPKKSHERVKEVSAFALCQLLICTNSVWIRVRLEQIFLVYRKKRLNGAVLRMRSYKLRFRVIAGMPR